MAAPNNQRPPFKQACWDGKIDEVRRLLSRGEDEAQLSQRDLDLGLAAAIDQRHREVAIFLLDHGAPMTGHGLSKALRRGKKIFVKEFLDRGWNPNTQLIFNEEPAQRWVSQQAKWPMRC